MPGHGPVAAEWAEASAPVRGFLDALAGAVRVAIADGLSLSQSVPEVAAVFAPLAGDWADFGPTTRRNVAAAFKELKWE